MPLHFLDTNVCIALLRGRASAATLPAVADCALSSITVAELWAGAEKSTQREKSAHAVHGFVELFAQLAFDRTAARHYGEIRAHLEKKGTPIGPLDQLIASHARSLDAAIITANVREFRRVPGLRCVTWKA